MPSNEVYGGSVKPGFEPVQEIFNDLIKEAKEYEVQLCVYVGQERVIDLWGSSRGKHKQKILAQFLRIQQSNFKLKFQVI